MSQAGREYFNFLLNNHIISRCEPILIESFNSYCRDFTTLAGITSSPTTSASSIISDLSRIRTENLPDGAATLPPHLVQAKFPALAGLYLTDRATAQASAPAAFPTYSPVPHSPGNFDFDHVPGSLHQHQSSHYHTATYDAFNNLPEQPLPATMRASNPFRRQPTSRSLESPFAPGRAVPTPPLGLEIPYQTPSRDNMPWRPAALVSPSPAPHRHHVDAQDGNNDDNNDNNDGHEQRETLITELFRTQRVFDREMGAWQHAVSQILAHKAALLRAQPGLLAVHEQLQVPNKCPQTAAPRGTDKGKVASTAQENAGLQGVEEITLCEDEPEPEPEPGTSDGQWAFHSRNRHRGGRQKQGTK
ncbi:hypothetical protein ColLi_09069 [Colletotrichum liriopes]|uniref:Uncharacterized protein n=1 Tax=Colletotrichum liriopes TaxID=708192 RepID=A0AA37LVZ2_9PEZI|nr:hypothetical protein ColLi_09069 [Colletotrichum liriopes]